jgi:hypothetical protein
VNTKSAPPLGAFCFFTHIREFPTFDHLGLADMFLFFRWTTVGHSLRHLPDPHLPAEPFFCFRFFDR